MTTSQFEVVHRVFSLAIERPDEWRGDLLLRECGGDREIMCEVESLLRHHDPAREILPNGLLGEAFNVRRWIDAGPAASLEAFDGFRVLRAIGQGGMAVVYEAEQDHPRRRVALKVMKEEISSKASLGRFDREVKALARLQHAGIPQIIAAGLLPGLTGGRPYLAMELVHGTSLVTYAAAHGMDVRARVGLLLQVCAAVSHAHRQGVIHRDLKSDNVLVDDTPDGPRVRVLDFGVSRLMDDAEQVVTQAGGPIGTPAYMSPEQLLGRAGTVDARSDVYSLGVVAFELLSGALPFPQRRNMADAVSRAEIEHAPPLSRHDRRLRGDLETMVACCLESEPARRYPTVEHFDRDLRRFLAGRPIAARAVTLTYSLRLLARRHRLAVFVGVVSALLLLGTTIALAVAVRRAYEVQAKLGQALLAVQAASDEKEQRYRSQLGSAVRYVDMIVQNLGSTAGTQISQRALLEQVEREVAVLRRELPNDPAAKQLAAEILLRISVIDLAEGKREHALRRRLEAYELTQRLYENEPDNEKLALQMALNYILIGDIHNEDGDYRAAGEWFARAEAIHRDQLARHPGDMDRLDDMAWTCFRTAGVCYSLGDIAGAMAKNHEGMQVSARHVALDSTGSKSLRGQWSLIGQRAKLAHSVGDEVEYAERVLSLRALARQLAEFHGTDRLAIRCVVETHGLVGLHLLGLGLADEAIEELRLGYQRARDWEVLEPTVQDARDSRCGFEEQLRALGAGLAGEPDSAEDVR